jgi:hypothetical protein
MKKLITKIDNYLYDFLGGEFYAALIVGILGIASFCLTCFVLWQILLFNLTNKNMTFF